MKKTLLTIFMLAMTFLSMAQVSSLTGKTVLFVYGGWDGHEPEQCRDIFVPWLQSEGAEVIVLDSLSVYSDKNVMDKVDLIVQTWTSGTRRTA